MYQIRMPERVVYGPNSFREIGEMASGLGRKALIVSDPIMLENGLAGLCAELLHEADIASEVYAGVRSEPTDAYVREGLEICRETGCDLVIGLGGGSCLDAAKAIAAMRFCDGEISDYAGNRQTFRRAPLPLIAIPTTAGTGSEVTKVTVIIDTRSDTKLMISQPELLPRIAVVDPMLTLSCPPNVTAATGIDALCHAVEAYLSRLAHPVTDTLALGAIDHIFGHLLAVYRDGGDIEARSRMSVGAMMAGAAFSNASVTLVHGMSRPIGALFHVPHGISNAMLLPAVLEYTRPEAMGRLAEIGRRIRPDQSGLSTEEWADVMVEETKALCRALHIPNLHSWGIDRDKFEQALPKMAADALESGSPGNNPRVPDKEAIIQLYRICYDYSLSHEQV
ncbi:iron-containing alcohol dehydrogenase [Cohnella caldifontis]|uniref:iron-containing alcohol dehydrogenase n=1 Tax=Cohnella caldifontis TaxID=3027471 RepID=UPI0023EC724D|nr:iron-containing alcohol dehydrogenase [Cohnella sp. YIM B05605]